MTDQEAINLTELKVQIQSKKNACWLYLVSLDQADARQLETAGHKGKTNAEAMQWAFRGYQKDLAKLVAAHIKKYPDQGL